MDQLDALKKIIDNAGSQELVETLSKGALKLDQDHINTVQFTFWLVYMAETDLNEVIQEAWKLATSTSDQTVIDATKALLQEGVKGEKEINLDNLEYFADKIKIYESFYGKDSRTKLFWKLNDIRKDLFHNRLDALTYNDEDLNDIDVRRKLLKDYFETALEDKDWTQSDFYKGLSGDEIKRIKQKFNSLNEPGPGYK